MHVARVPDFPPPIDKIAYVRAGGVDPADLETSPPPAPPPAPMRRRGHEWVFGLTGIVLGAVATAIVLPSTRREASTREPAPVVATPATTEADLQAMVGWDVAGAKHETTDSGYRNPLPVLLLGRP